MGLTFSNLGPALAALFHTGPMDQTNDTMIGPVRMSGIGTTGSGLTAARAVFVYMGRARRAWTPSAISALIRTAPTGTGQIEMWMGTSAQPPLRNTTRELTRVWSWMTTVAPTTTVPLRFTAPTIPQIASGAHLWLGIRSVSWTAQPSVEAGGLGGLTGSVMFSTTVGDLTLSPAASIATGSLTIPAAGDLTPYLRLEI